MRSISKNLGICGGLLFLFVSCNFKPTYERPEIDLRSEWRFAPEGNGDFVNLSWWQQFQDPILEELIQKALRNNQNLQVASSRILEFYAKYRIAFSEFFPQLGAEGGVDRIKLSEEVDIYQTFPGVPRTNNLYSLFGGLSYELDFWGRIRNTTEAAKAEYLSLVESRRTVILSLVSSIALAYVQLMQLDNQLGIMKLTHESRENGLEIAMSRFEFGEVSEREVKQAEAAMDVSRAQITLLETLIPQQENLMSVLIGEVPGPIARGKLPTDLKLSFSVPAGLPSDLLENRPDILQAEQNIIAANALVGVARAIFFPSISLTGLAGQISTSAKEFMSESANLIEYGINALQPIFTGGKIIYQNKEADALLKEAVHAYQQTVLVAFQEVENALISHQKAKERLQIQQNQVAALEDHLSLSTLLYEYGEEDYSAVLEAEQPLLDAKLELSATQGDVFATLVVLYKSLGQGWKVESELVDSGNCSPELK